MTTFYSKINFCSYWFFSVVFLNFQYFNVQIVSIYIFTYIQRIILIINIPQTLNSHSLRHESAKCGPRAVRMRCVLGRVVARGPDFAFSIFLPKN